MGRGFRSRKLWVGILGQLLVFLSGLCMAPAVAQLAIPSIAALAGIYVGVEGAADVRGRVRRETHTRPYGHAVALFLGLNALGFVASYMAQNGTLGAL